MATGRIKGITIEIGGDTTKLVSALKNVDSQIKQTQATLKDVNKLLKLDPGNTELLRQKQNQLNNAIGLTKDRLTELRNAQDQVSKNTDEWDALQREIIETEQQLKSLESEIKDFGSIAQQKIKVVGEKFQEVGSKIESAGRAMMKVSTVAAGAIGGIAKLGYSAVQSADELNTLSKQTGVSTDELQKWSYAADLVDVDVETITSSMKRMKKNLDSNSDAFAELGVNTKDSSGNFRDATEIFYDTLSALSQIDNETERDIIAMKLFGKNADELAGIIDDGGAALRAYGKEAENLGLIIGGDTLDKLNQANDAIDKMKATIGGSLAQAGATIAQTFAPAMEKVAAIIDKVAERIRNLTPEQVEMITKILGIVAAIGPLLIILGKLIGVIGFVMQNITVISAVLSAILSPIGLVVIAIGALVAAFIHFYNTNEEFRERVNSVIESVKEVFGTFVAKVKEWLDAILSWIAPVVDAVKEYLSAVWEFVSVIFGFIGTLITGFLQRHETAIKNFLATMKLVIGVAMDLITGIVKTKIDLIKNIFTTVISTITEIIKAFTAFLKGDWSGAMDHLKQAAQNAWDGVKNIFTTLGRDITSIFKNLISDFAQWGRDMVDNLVSGLESRIDRVTKPVKTIASKIKSYLHFSEPDVGPLSDFHTYMPDMINMLVKGINAGVPMVSSAMNNLAGAMVPNVADSMSTKSMTNNNNVNITVYGAEGQDVNELADIIQDRINAEVYSRGAVFA